MPNVPLRCRAIAPALCAAAALVGVAAPPAQAQISFYTAVDLALRNSHEVHMAAADVQRAEVGVKQTRDAYVPSMSLGSNLGYSYGFPVGQPSIIDVQANSLLFSLAQPYVIRSARSALQAAQASLKDTREKIVAQASLAYTELDTDEQELTALRQQHDFGERLVEIEAQRADAGVASRMEVTEAQITNAQLELRLLHLTNHMDLLRLKLANLTGLPVADIRTRTASVPLPPPAPGHEAMPQTIEASPAMQSAEFNAESKQRLAHADARKIWSPQIAFGIQYSRYAEFNNYAEYYLRFQHNNFDVGINITMPIFDIQARDAARASAADAVHAREQAALLRTQLSEHSLEASDGLDELRLQEKIAGLQSDYARENLEAVNTRIQNGPGNPNATPLTPLDQEKARIEERRRYVDKLDADFQLMQAQIQLQRTLGTVEQWAMQAPNP